jgi:hypothetical protein
MDTTREQQLENDLDADFSVSVEGFRAGADRKRLCIRRGSHTESVVMSDAEAQAVMMSLMSAFPGALSELLEAARPLADLLFDHHPAGEMVALQVDAGDVTRLKNAVGAIDEALHV